jgi:hypothetical protein
LARPEPLAHSGSVRQAAPRRSNPSLRALNQLAVAQSAAERRVFEPDPHVPAA